MPSSTNYFTFWQRWLTIVNILFVLAGLVIAFAGNSQLFNHYNVQTGIVFFDGTIPKLYYHSKIGYLGLSVALLLVFTYS